MLLDMVGIAGMGVDMGLRWAVGRIARLFWGGRRRLGVGGIVFRWRRRLSFEVEKEEKCVHVDVDV